MPTQADAADVRQRLSLWQIASLSCGLFGVQIVWALQNVNTSRIFQTLGANVAELPMLWIAGPIAGLIVQPIIGHWSDRTWGRFGRRKPFMLVGAFLAALSLLLMANSATVLAASLMLWLLTISINIVMEPFRALLADLLPEEQRDAGFALQVLFIGSGAVFASALPWLFAQGFGWSGEIHGTGLPLALRAAFYTGAGGLILTVLWSVASARERPPSDATQANARALPLPSALRVRQLTIRGLAWIAGAAVLATLMFGWQVRREGYLLCAVLAAFGIIQLLAARPRMRFNAGLGPIAVAMVTMPQVLRRLAFVQFATWFGLFAMWVYIVPSIATRHFDAAVAGDAAYNAAADYVGILFAIYNGVAAVFALLLPAIVRRIGRRFTHAFCLLIGAVGFAGLGLVGNANSLWIPVIALGCSWAAILSLPYAMVASAVPQERVGVYMGIHNIFLVLPQLAAATTLGPIISSLFTGNASRALDLAAAAFLVAAFLTLRIPSEAEPAKALTIT